MKNEFAIEKEILLHILRCFENNPKLQFKDQEKMKKFIRKRKIYTGLFLI